MRRRPMQDDEVIMLNACTDLVSLERSEACRRRLLGDKRPGEWIGVREYCRQIGIAWENFPPDLFATFLPDPAAHDGYVVIVFYDDDSKWSMAAQYNRSRLAGSQ